MVNKKAILEREKNKLESTIKVLEDLRDNLERRISFIGSQAIINGACWVRVEDYEDGIYICVDQHGGEYQAKESQLDWIK